MKNTLRRWGAVLTMFAGIAGAGAPVLAAGTVFPLFWSMAYPGWALVAVLAYSLAIGLLLWSARQLLWPRAWVESERVLPITPKQILVSDLEILSIALLPVGLVMLAGASLLLTQAPEWLRPFSGRAALSLGLVLMTSIGLMSTGTKRKVWLTAALVVGTTTVLLDEPMNALDRASATYLQQYLNRVAKERERCWVVASHEIPCQDLAVLSEMNLG